MCILLNGPGIFLTFPVRIAFQIAGGFVFRNNRLGGAEEARDFLVAFGDEGNTVADLNACAEVFNMAEAEAAVGGVFADGLGVVGAVNAEAFDVKTDPVGAAMIAGARADHGARMVVSRIFEAVSDPIFAIGAGADGRADGDVVNFEDALAFKEGELAVGKADDDATGGRGRRFAGELGGGLPNGLLRGGANRGENRKSGKAGEAELRLSGAVSWPAHRMLPSDR